MTRRGRIWLACLAVVFLGWHAPLMYRTGAGQDEDWYGVPGITILRSGLPRIPYLPARDRQGVVYRADVILYTLPPLSFYLQALAQAILGVGIGPARMASTFAGLAAVYLVYDLARRWFDDERGALLAATAYIFSRAFFFPATTARPDMAATAFGLLAIWWAVRYRRDRRWRSLAAGGASAGLSLLAHPFGIVPATQVGLWLLAGPDDLRRRLQEASLFAGVALAVFSLWLPLIALHPDLFMAQFGHILNLAGTGLGRSSLGLPSMVVYQLRQIWGYVGPIQVCLYVLGLSWGLVRARSTPGGREFLYHLGASILLLIFFEGRHPTLGYYAYPAGLASIAVGMLAGRTSAWLERRGGAPTARRRGFATALVTAALLLALLPGAGLRPFLAHLRHWDDPSYDAHALSRLVMADLPTGSLVAVDEAYVLDFYLAGRRVVDLTIHPLSYDVRTQPFEYAVFGPATLRAYRSRMEPLMLIKTYGDRNDPFAPYAELYRRARTADREAAPGK